MSPSLKMKSSLGEMRGYGEGGINARCKEAKSASSYRELGGGVRGGKTRKLAANWDSWDI